MQLLAIRSSNGKGVYVIDGKEEKQELINKYLGCSYRIFKRKEEEEALRWAGERRIANLPEEMTISISSKKQKSDSFLATLEHFSKLGYTHVELTLSNGEKYKIWIRDFRYLIFSQHLRWKSKEHFYYEGGSVYSFNNFKEKLENSFTTWTGSFLYDNETTLEDVLYNLIKYLCKEYNHFFNLIKRPNITINGEYIIIDSTFQDERHKSSRNYIQCIEEIQVQKNIAINKGHIINIKPLDPIDSVIDDEMYNKVIDKLIGENIVTIDGSIV